MSVYSGRLNWLWSWNGFSCWNWPTAPLNQVNILGLRDNNKHIKVGGIHHCCLFILQLFPVRFPIVTILTNKISTNSSIQFSPGFLRLDCHFYRLPISEAKIVFCQFVFRNTEEDADWFSGKIYYWFQRISDLYQKHRWQFNS